MRIRFLSGPKKDAVAHAPVNQNTQLLIDSGLVAVVPDEPLPPATVSWGVKFDSFGNPMLLGSCSRGCGMFRFLGKPEFASKNFFQHSCGGAMPTPVPAEVIAQYKRAYDGATPSGTMDDAKLLDARKIGGRIDAAYESNSRKFTDDRAAGKSVTVCE